MNILCDVALGRSDSEDTRRLLELLTDLTARRRVVCPIELHVFIELLRQRLPEKRAATARLVDSLSHGITIVVPPERVFLEVLSFALAARAGPPFPAAPGDEVWT